MLRPNSFDLEISNDGHPFHDHDIDAAGGLVHEDHEEEVVALSYIALDKRIKDNHPRHPLTGEKYSVVSQVSVKNCCAKIADPCNLRFVCSCFVSCYSYCARRMRGDPKPTEVPESVTDDTKKQLEQGENADDHEEYGGLGQFNAISSRIGIGAGVYL